MANIGSFKKVGNDFQGEIVTLSLQAKGVRIVAESQPLQRQRSEPPDLRRPGRDRRRLVEALRGRPRLPLAQARRSLLQRADLREPVRRRGRRRLHPAVVAAAARTASKRSVRKPPRPVRRAGLSHCPNLTFFASTQWPICAGCLFDRSLRASSSGATRSAWLMPSALASSNKRHHRRIASASFEAADILLGKAGSVGKAFLGKRLCFSKSLQNCGRPTCAYPYAQVGTLHTMRFIHYNMYLDES